MRVLLFCLILGGAPGCASVAYDSVVIPGTGSRLIVGAKDNALWVEAGAWVLEDGKSYEVTVVSERRPHGGYRGTLGSIKSLGGNRFLLTGRFGFDALEAEAEYDHARRVLKITRQSIPGGN